MNRLDRWLSVSQHIPAGWDNLRVHVCCCGRVWVHEVDEDDIEGGLFRVGDVKSFQRHDCAEMKRRRKRS